MHLLVAAQSGWGKGYLTQSIIERNAPDYDQVCVLDYADEYRGVVEANRAEWWIGGPRELQWSDDEWNVFFTNNPRVVLSRHDRIPADKWREICSNVARHIRKRSGSTLIVLDEAHFVVPQRESYPSILQELATTGRGEQISYIVVTQRLSEIDKTVSTQMQSRLLGGFDGDDLDRVKPLISGYDRRLHDPLGDVQSTTVPDDLLPEDRENPVTLQRHTDDNKQTVGSEWIYSNSSGDRRRIDTTGLNVVTHHYSPEGAKIELPT